MNRLLHRCRASISLLTAAFVLFAALAPSLAALAAPAVGGNWTLICTSRGWERVPSVLDHAPGVPVPASLLHASDHCPLCRTPGDTAVALPALTPAPPLVAFQPPRISRTPRPLVAAAWSLLPPSRAPPIAC